MDNEALVGLFTRSALLGFAGQQDVADDLMKRAAEGMIGAADDLTRDLYAFLNGFAACLAYTGQSPKMLKLLQQSNAGDDPAKMRTAIRDVLLAVS